ncbi:hypothetical protein [uncultured Shewanella sp.]|uniref:hypothetical protein n=1 Tax=Shewanella atlantica TaxID=271099 RepID=UPI00261963E8|nr:hypothetical protein [uncultured Shewanella sp.]
MSNFNDFFEKLGTDSDLMDAYKQDPEGVMKANGLTDEEIATVMSGDTNKIKSLSGESVEAKTYMIIASPKDTK